MAYTYAVLGAGRQGTAAAFDMLRFGQAGRVILADVDQASADKSALRLKGATFSSVTPVHIDVSDAASLDGLLSEVDAVLSAVPYPFNLGISQSAIRTRTHMCDLGGHVGIARSQHRLDEAARSADISIIPNCGQVPGLGTILMAHAIELLDEPEDILMWDGGIPQNPKPPFHYLLTFNMAGLTNEYAEPAVFIRDWKRTEVETMTELETVEFPEPIGRLEAFVAGGGTDTMPWTYEGRVRTLQNKTLRHPGHFAQLRAFFDLGLWDTAPLQVGDSQVVPRDVFHTLFEPKVTFPAEKDVVIIRVRATGRNKGAPAEAILELIDYFDEDTGFSAMERCTGWAAAIVAQMMVQGATPRGCAGVEKQVPPEAYLKELARRGIEVTVRVNS